MSENLPLQGPGRGANEPRGVGPAAERTARVDAGQGAAFKALLEKLERRADELEQKSRAELPAEELRGAVDEARESMRDALALQEELLEAWRQARQQARAPEPDGGDAAP